MTPIRKSGGANVALTTLKRRAGGAWANVQNGYRRSGGTWVRIYSAYTAVSATISTTIVSKSGSGTSTQPVTSPAVVAAGHDGSGAYTYVWEHVSGDTFTLTGQSSSTTQFSASLAVNATQIGVYRCKVSDGTSTAYTPNVTITLDNPKPV